MYICKKIIHQDMKELIFIIESDIEGGFNARSIGENIYTQADSVEELKSMIIDAIDCHFENPLEKPSKVRLQAS
jgi:predicted RNase H-like HicB family nuclease